jgi:hypothetical protein
MSAVLRGKGAAIDFTPAIIRGAALKSLEKDLEPLLLGTESLLDNKSNTPARTTVAK